MEKKTTDKRRAPISYRPPKDRAEEFYARVEESGLSVNAFLTEAIFGRSRHRPAELKMLALLLARCAQIRDSLAPLSDDPDMDKSKSMRKVSADLSALRNLLLIMMGRKP